MSKIIRVDRFGREIYTPTRPGRRGMRKFRMHARRFLLTYSCVPEGLTWQSVVKQLEKNLGAEKYAIVRERHATGEPHFHVILVSQKKMDIPSPREFDIVFKKQTYSCNAQTIRCYHSTVRYVCKGKKYETNIKEIYDGELVSRHEVLIEKARLWGPDLALEEYIRDHPKEALGSKNVVSLRKSLTTVLAIDKGIRQIEEQAAEVVFTLNDSWNMIMTIMSIVCTKKNILA